MVTPTNHVIAGSDLHRAGLWHFGDFCNIFLPNLGEDQKKSLTISARGVWLILHLIMENLALINALRS